MTGKLIDKQKRTSLPNSLPINAEHRSDFLILSRESSAQIPTLVHLHHTVDFIYKPETGKKANGTCGKTNRRDKLDVNKFIGELFKAFVQEINVKLRLLRQKKQHLIKVVKMHTAVMKHFFTSQIVFSFP